MQEILECLLVDHCRLDVLIVTAAVACQVTKPFLARVIVTARIAVGLAVVAHGAFRLALRLLVAILVAFLLERLNLIHLVVDEFGHLGIVFFQHLPQQALLLHRNALSLFLYER